MADVYETALKTDETRRLIAGDKVEGTAVCRSNGEKIGTIDRLMIEKRSGKVAYAVLTFGGFLGLGQGYYALPWSVLTYNVTLDAYELNLTDEQLQGAPAYVDDVDPVWESEVHDYYGVPPYWI